jgi:molecular chaperone GrpE
MEEKKENIQNQEVSKTQTEENINISEENKESQENKPTVEELEKKVQELEQKLKKTEEQAKKLSILYQTLTQDFETYKARTIKEKQMAVEEGIEKFAKELLNIIDNFEKAIESAKVSEDVSALAKGVQMIHYQLLSILEKFGIQEILGEGEFNPEKHEAVDTYISTEHKPNEIVKVLQKGYTYKGKVLRPARVVVAIPPEEMEEIT